MGKGTLSVFFKSIVTAMGLTYLFNISVVSAWPWLICFFVYLVFRIELHPEKRMRYCASICAAILALAITLVRIEEWILIDIRLINLIKLCVLMASGYWLFQRLIMQLYLFFDKCGSRLFQTVRKPKNKIYFIIQGTILLCWLPYYLTYYPAVMCDDTMAQVNQIFGVKPWSNHHPVMHTLCIKALYSVAKFLGFSETNAFGFVSAVQMILMAGIFAAVIYFLYKKCVRKEILILVWAFYALTPFHGIYSVTLWKDIWFAGIVTAFLLVLAIFLEDKNSSRKAWLYIPMVILGVGVCLFRSNGYYAFILFGIASIVFFKRLKWRIGIFGLVIAISAIIKGPIYDTMEVVPSDLVESISVPAQNIAYVVSSQKELTMEEYELLNEIVEVERIPELYKNYISDPIKLLIRWGNLEYLENHKAEYLKLWLKIGIRYPVRYLVSWVNQTKGYWYPDVLYWVYLTCVYENEFGINRNSLVPETVEGYLETWLELYKDIPLLNIAWSIGIYVWILLVMSGYVVYKKNWDVLLVYSLIWGIWASLLMATPVFAEFRYFYSVIASSPLLFIMPLFERTVYDVEERAG